MINNFNMLWQRFLEGTNSLRERYGLFKRIRYLQKNFVNDVLAELRALRLHPDETLPETVYQRIELQADIQVPVLQPAEPGTRRLYRWMPVAASIAIVLAAAVWMMISDGSAQLPQENLLVKHGPARFYLADGSKVVLDDSSTLTIDTIAYGKARRAVTLKGQAFFKVKPNRSAPFTVRAGKVTTTVLGTSFNVNARARKNDIRVTVREGKVSVNDGEDHTARIRPNQQITVNTISHTFIKRNVNADTTLAWMNHNIPLGNVSLAEAIWRIEEKFNVTVVFASEDLKKIVINARFIDEKDIQLEGVLQVIETLTKTTFTVKGDTITIREKRSNPPSPR